MLNDLLHAVRDLNSPHDQVPCSTLKLITAMKRMTKFDPVAAGMELPFKNPAGRIPTHRP
jgi:hypothetical protein